MVVRNGREVSDSLFGRGGHSGRKILTIDRCAVAYSRSEGEIEPTTAK